MIAPRNRADPALPTTSLGASSGRARGSGPSCSSGGDRARPRRPRRGRTRRACCSGKSLCRGRSPPTPSPSTSRARRRCPRRRSPRCASSRRAAPARPARADALIRASAAFSAAASSNRAGSTAAMQPPDKPRPAYACLLAHHLRERGDRLGAPGSVPPSLFEQREPVGDQKPAGRRRRVGEELVVAELNGTGRRQTTRYSARSCIVIAPPAVTYVATIACARSPA